MLGCFRSASEAAIAYYKYKKSVKGGTSSAVHKRPRTFQARPSPKRYGGVLQDALSAAREKLPSSEDGVQLIRSNIFSGYHMVNVQASARRQMLDQKSFHIPSVKAFYVEARTSSGKHFLGSFETNVAAAVCVATFLRERPEHVLKVRKPKSKDNPGEQGEVRHSTRHFGCARTTYIDEDEMNVCALAEDDEDDADDGACLKWVQCDLCNKWRKVSGFDDIGDLWTCAMNPDSLYNDCGVEEDVEDNDCGVDLAEKDSTEKDLTSKAPANTAAACSMLPALDLSKITLRQCTALLEQIKEMPEAAPLLVPIDPWQYPTIVKSPMDLDAIDKKLTSNSYRDVESFVADVRLVFRNPYIYKKNMPVGNATEVLDDKFETKLRELIASSGAVPITVSDASRFAPAPASITEQTILEKLEILKKEFGYCDKKWTAIEVVNNVASLTGISVQGNLRTRLDILYNELK